MVGSRRVEVGPVGYEDALEMILADPKNVIQALAP
jgi:hypothetical protein